MQRMSEHSGYFIPFETTLQLLNEKKKKTPFIFKTSFKLKLSMAKP
jgi:hypothetical protein